MGNAPTILFQVVRHDFYKVPLSIADVANYHEDVVPRRSPSRLPYVTTPMRSPYQNQGQLTHVTTPMRSPYQTQGQLTPPPPLDRKKTVLRSDLEQQSTPSRDVNRQGSNGSERSKTEVSKSSDSSTTQNRDSSGTGHETRDSLGNPTPQGAASNRTSIDSTSESTDASSSGVVGVTKRLVQRLVSQFASPISSRERFAAGQKAKRKINVQFASGSRSSSSAAPPKPPPKPPPLTSPDHSTDTSSKGSPTGSPKRNPLFPGVDPMALLASLLSTNKQSSVPSKEHSQGEEHPLYPGQPYISTTSADASFTTSSGAFVDLYESSRAGLVELRPWKDTIPRLLEGAKEPQVYHWWNQFEKFLCSKGIFAPLFTDFYNEDPEVHDPFGFAYDALMPGILRGKLSSWDTQIYQLLQHCVIDREDEEPQALISAVDSGYQLAGLLLQDTHPAFDCLGREPSKQFDRQCKVETFQQLVSRVNYFRALDEIYSKPWRTTDYVYFLIVGLYPQSLCETLRAKFEEDWNSNNEKRKRLYSTAQQCAAQIAKYHSAAQQSTSFSRRKFLSPAINSLRVESEDSVEDEVLIDVHSVSDVALLDIASIGELLSMEGLDDSLTAHVYSLVEQNQTSIPENLLSEECAVFGRHKDTSKCNHLLSHLLRKELLEKYPAFAARLNVLMRKRYEKILGTRSNLGKQDFRKGGI